MYIDFHIVLERKLIYKLKLGHERRLQNQREHRAYDHHLERLFAHSASTFVSSGDQAWPTWGSSINLRGIDGV